MMSEWDLGGGGGGGVSGITEITSTGGTVTITDPAGPTTNLEVASGFWVPLSETIPNTLAPFAFVYQSTTFNGVLDPIWEIGYNPTGTVSAEPQWYMGMEGNYRILAGTEGWDNSGPHNLQEWYINRTSQDGTTTLNYRPIYIGTLRDTNASRASHIYFDIGTAGFPNSQFQVNGTSNILTIVDGLVAISAGNKFTPGALNSQISQWVTQGANQFTTTRTANQVYYQGVNIALPCTITGISIYNGSTATGNILVALYNSAGTQVAVSASTAQSGTQAIQSIPFTGTYAAVPGLYYLAIVPSSASSTFNCIFTGGSGGSAAAGSFTMPGTITPPAISGTVETPWMSTY